MEVLEFPLIYLNTYYVNYKMFRNICLIGLPTAGKTRIGKLLYQHLNMGFINTDDLIRQKYNRELPELITQFGNKGFLDMETEVIQSLNHQNVVLATGGSVIHREKSMDHIKNVLKADVYHLFLSKRIFLERMNKSKGREKKIIINKDQTLSDLYNERMGLYDVHSDFIIKACDKVNLDSFKPYDYWSPPKGAKEPIIMYTNKDKYIDTGSRPSPSL
jgi:shikimate kinase